MTKNLLPIIDEIIINEDGTITGWACAINDLADHSDSIPHEQLQECAARNNECPRGFTEPFACEEGR